jgi:methylated-DNA-[protein]-cysteine S-methyltransferase
MFHPKTGLNRKSLAERQRIYARSQAGSWGSARSVVLTRQLDHFYNELEYIQMWKTILSSPVGQLHAFSNSEALCALLWGESEDNKFGRDAQFVDAGLHPILRRLEQQLTEYFTGTRLEFDLPLEPAGSKFQLAVWNALRKIPFGETRSYSEQATMIGNPTAVRAVGAANGRNPISIVVPCHRVIGKNGDLTGFGGGIPVKQFLLDHERHYKDSACRTPMKLEY